MAFSPTVFEEMTLDETMAFVEARETGKNSVKILSGGLTSGQVHKVHEKKKANCGAFDHKCKQCSRKGHYKDFCTWKKNPKKEVSEDSKKTSASGNKVEIHRMEMTQTSGKVLGISQEHKRLMKNQQNMTKLHHETWCEKSQSYRKSKLPEEPTLKLRMSLDIKAYAKHNPPLQCLVDNKPFDILPKKSTANTGAQCFLLGADHLPDLGLCVEDLLQSEINLNCANSTMADNLGVFYAKIRGRG